MTGLNSGGTGHPVVKVRTEKVAILSVTAVVPFSANSISIFHLVYEELIHLVIQDRTNVDVHDGASVS